MSNRIITVSRQFGSGGRTIGRKAAERLGISCYDAELIQKIAEESGFAQNYIREEGEYASSGRFSPFFSNRSMGLTNQDRLWKIQSKIILDIAAKESCVIVGRCADYILREEADCLRVFIHADVGKRAERIVKVYGETAQSPEKRLLDKDKRRSSYYRFYTDMEWGRAENYHIALDSGKLGIEKCIEIISDLF